MEMLTEENSLTDQAIAIKRLMHTYRRSLSADTFSKLQAAVVSLDRLDKIRTDCLRGVEPDDLTDKLMEMLDLPTG